MNKRLYRLPDQGQITGVAAGIAEYFNWDVTVVRVLLVIAAFFTDGGVILGYFLLALVLPVKGQGSADIGDKLKSLVDSSSTSRVRNWLGLGLIVLGGWYLLGTVLPGITYFSWGTIWPVILILLGIFILAKGRK